jgi:hypothetical protein
MNLNFRFVLIYLIIQMIIMYPSALLLLNICCVTHLYVRIAYHQKHKVSYCFNVFLLTSKPTLGRL